MLQVMNDLLYIRADELDLRSVATSSAGTATDEEAVTSAMQEFRRLPQLVTFLQEIAQGTVLLDWRTSSFPGLDPEERRRQSAYRGSGGYGLIRQDLIDLLAGQRGTVGYAAREVREQLISR